MSLTHSHGGGCCPNGAKGGMRDRRLLLAMGINLLLPLCQVVGGIQAQSMALISDAAHNAGDFAGLFIAYCARRMAERGPTLRYTFGYRRAEVLAALINVLLLLAATLYIIFEAVDRLRHPKPVAGATVVVLAALGVVGNGVSAYLLHRDAAGDLNLRGAFVHLMADLLTSAAVLACGAVLLFKPWYWLDPLLSLCVTVFILKSSWAICKEAAAILMEATPLGLDLAAISEALKGVEGVVDVHHLHVWSVGSQSVSFTCHVRVNDAMLSTFAPLGEELRALLLTRFGVDHAVLEFEVEGCGKGDLLCGH